MVNHLQTKTGSIISWVGPDSSEGPLPAFFYFALSGDESLTLDPFNQPIVALPNIRCYSLTLPYHGDGFQKTEAMTLWAEELKEDHDIVTPFIQTCCEAIDFVVSEGLANPNQISVGGLSRGGLIAFHIAANHPLANTILAFAPITDLGYLFKSIASHELVKTLSPMNLIDKLIGKKVRIYIGNRDERVGTGEAFAFVEELTNHSFDTGLRSPPVELIISPSIGFKGHGTPQHIFEQGTRWISL